MLEHNLKHIEYSLPRSGTGSGRYSGGYWTKYPSGLYARRVAMNWQSLPVHRLLPHRTNLKRWRPVMPWFERLALKGLAASLMKIANDVRWPLARAAEVVKSQSRKMSRAAQSCQGK